MEQSSYSVQLLSFERVGKVEELVVVEERREYIERKVFNLKAVGRGIFCVNG